MSSIKALLVIISMTLLFACSTGRYQQAHDSIPTRLPNQSELKDATPRAEPYSRGGNKDYRVRGIDYKVLNNALGFEQTGIASWYGNKFHGHLTSNGEIYDMYAMSAAHKNLPLPTYVKVTNLSNNKSVIVRVNDRGPFHKGRVIDLSYSAAYKLNMLQTGTAEVKISAINTFANKTTPNTAAINNSTNATSVTANPHAGDKNYIQVFATSKLELAKKKAKLLTQRYKHAVNYPKENGIYRIQIGPILNTETLNQLLETLKQSDYPNAYLRSL